ncbi:MAG: hypothetical protein E4H14_06715 [Candidatus Thorarchaeota archaeon]|nr:MAG: hypothetical protein E4H14_06715 [Candidatus Thorarchaeota archaeon]
MESYKTSDIVLAAYLRLSGCQIIGIEKEGRQGTFVFASVDESLIRTFGLGNATVEPVAFHGAIRQLTTSVRLVDA